MLFARVGDIVPSVVVWNSCLKRIVNRHETTVICVVYKNFIIIHYHFFAKNVFEEDLKKINVISKCQSKNNITILLTK